jgi:hypothetical protein
MKRLLLPLILLLVITAEAQVKEKKIRKYAETIKAKELKKKLSIIASEEMEGRETATEGQRKAAAYIEGKFREYGLQPGNGNSYQQPYSLYQDSVTSHSFTINGNTLEVMKDYYLDASSATGNWTINNIYFAGTGMIDTTVDVKDKWVLTDESRFAVLRTKIGWLRRSKAKGVIVVSKGLPAKERFNAKGRMGLQPATNSGFPYLSVSFSAASNLLKAQLDSAALSQLPKKDYAVNAAYSVAKTTLKLESTNVLGVLPGTDKADEYVFVTAHYDHIGRSADGRINYGADDDGSGTTAVLQMAEAFAKAKKKGHGPRRSIVFMTVSGEEKGLLGSEYYSDHPLFPLDKTNVDLNIDMIGRIDPKYKGDSLNYVFVIGDDKLSSDLKPITDSINRTYMNMELDRRYNDVSDPNRFYYRSDHYNFAKKGVPIIFYFNGTHADYHRPTDTIDKINFNLMEKRARLVFYTAWEMANRNDFLKRDIPLNVPPR